MSGKLEPEEPHSWGEEGPIIVSQGGPESRSVLAQIAGISLSVLLGVSLLANGFLISRFLERPSVRQDLASARAESEALRSELDYQRDRANAYANRLGLDYPGKAPSAAAQSPAN